MRRLLPVLIALAALPVATGCGSEDLPSVSVADAAQATRDAHTARTTLRLEMRGMGLPGSYTLTGEGVVATAAPRMDITFDLSSLVEEGDANARVVLDGRRIYVELPDIEELELPGGARWATVDLVKAVQAVGIDPAGLRELFHLSPEQQLAAIEAAGNLKEVGEEEIGGVRTTHLRGTLTMRDYARSLSPERRAQLNKAIRQLAELSGEDPQELDAPTPTEMWVDEDAHIRRMTQRTEIPAQQGVPAGSMAMTMEFDDFGTELDFEPPDSGDVFDATDMLVNELRAGP